MNQQVRYELLVEELAERGVNVDSDFSRNSRLCRR